MSLSLPAYAAWTNVHPGVDYSQWTNGTPQRISAIRVDLCYPGVSLRATKSGERRQTPSSFGQSVGAEVAINGDFFRYEDYSTTGLAIGDGQLWPGSSDPTSRGFVGVGDGRVDISNPPEQVTDIGWINDAVGGNVMVLHNGNVTGDTGSFCTTRHPRTVVGLSQDERTMYLAVIDGRSTSSVGMRCDEMGVLMKNLGAWNALNLDGGGSSAMWLRGSGVVNHPSDGSQRVTANHLAVDATGSGLPEACNDMDAVFDVNFLGLDDFYTDGSSGGVPDVLVGDEFQAEILFSNSSGTILRGVTMDYWFESPYLTPLSYSISSDHPAYDQASWTVNSADGAPENPARDAMGQTDLLTMHAFSAQETKRVLLELQAPRYSIGKVDHPDVRGWIHHIDDIYGEQSAWNQEPSNANHLGALMQDYAQLDVLSPYEWQFNGGDAQLEGWSACDGDAEGLRVDVEAGAMVLGKGCAKSPDWTAVDADTYDQMVIRASSLTEATHLEVRGASDHASLGGVNSSAAFVLQSDETTHTYVVPVLADGEVAAMDIRAHPIGLGLQDGVSVDAIFFQDSANQTTSSADEGFVDQAPVELVDPNSSGGGEDAGVEQDASDGEDTGAGGVVDAGGDAGSAESGAGASLSGSSGCACGTASGSGSGLAGLLFGGVLVGVRRWVVCGR
jgi:hypothetical protein